MSDEQVDALKEEVAELLARIAELEAALKPFADASDLHLGSDDMSIAFRIIIGNLRQARKVLENAWHQYVRCNWLSKVERVLPT